METGRTPTLKNGAERKELKTGECEGMARAAGGKLRVIEGQQKPGAVRGLGVWREEVRWGRTVDVRFRDSQFT